ncbi:hypothetical protein BCT69_06920 [Enterovibrio norvegicus]|nr:hypothetical protein BCT69_06920 [Enterovibrio norvegicus]
MFDRQMHGYSVKKTLLFACLDSSTLHSLKPTLKRYFQQTSPTKNIQQTRQIQCFFPSAIAVLTTFKNPFHALKPIASALGR